MFSDVGNRQTSFNPPPRRTYPLAAVHLCPLCGVWSQQNEPTVPSLEPGVVYGRGWQVHDCRLPGFASLAVHQDQLTYFQEQPGIPWMAISQACVRSATPSAAWGPTLEQPHTGSPWRHSSVPTGRAAPQRELPQAVMPPKSPQQVSKAWASVQGHKLSREKANCTPSHLDSARHGGERMRPSPRFCPVWPNLTPLLRRQTYNEAER